MSRLQCGLSFQQLYLPLFRRPQPSSDVTLSRLSVQVKLQGVRVELTELEHHLSSFPGIRQALAAVHTDKMNQQHLVAYLLLKNIDTKQLRQHVAKFLLKPMIPELFVLLDQFPKMQWES